MTEKNVEFFGFYLTFFLKLFKGEKIWTCGERYTKEQGKYPIIFITLKDVKFDSWKATLAKIKELIAQEFSRHRELKKNSEKINEYDIIQYNKVINGTAEDVVCESALEILSRMLHDHYGVAPIIIIDEYDIPIQQGRFKNFYEDKAILQICARQYLAARQGKVLKRGSGRTNRRTLRMPI